jgi:preprotein translocase subunit SecA
LIIKGNRSRFSGIEIYGCCFFLTSVSRSLAFTKSVTLAAGRPYAERSERPPGWHDQAAEFLLTAVATPVRQRLRDPAHSLRGIVRSVAKHEHTFHALDDADLAARAHAMRALLRRKGFDQEIVGECFAIVREAATRTLGQRHYAEQLIAGWGLLQGKLVEMATGEGKTIAATLPACIVALAGYPVHVITVNDYLAQRDADFMEPLYGFLGLSVGAVVQGMSRVERQQIYGRSIAYCSNKELAFDYLRDRVVAARRGSQLHAALESLRSGSAGDRDLVLRGLYYGIVDEADSVFVDEARTPLILSKNVGASEEAIQCQQALDFAGEMSSGEDYLIELAERSIRLTEAGEAKLAELAAGFGGVWTSVRAREELVTQALSALILFRRDQHYVVSDGKVQIVDESTGRVMPDRSWERGLQQLIEVKEGCEPTQRRETLARITYQRLYRRYIRLAGMTGTAREVAREIKSVYGLDVVKIPLHKPSQRSYCGTRICATRAQKWNYVAETVGRLVLEQHRPVLIGTRSVAASEEISTVLSAKGIEHALLNAKQDQSEADIIALAGQSGRVTVATNMAGRGTDIRLGDKVAERGGLHVILTEYHESRRIDRQLYGRCARQGDPGSCEAVVSLEDEIFAVFAPRATKLLKWFSRNGTKLPAQAYRRLRMLAQYSAERRSAQLRTQNLKLDQRLDQVLAFSGRGE